MEKKFSQGDKVFAKVRGYPPWPARIENVTGEPGANLRFHVFFYGTYETGVCVSKNLFHYEDVKVKLGKPSKLRRFNVALSEIQGSVQLPDIVKRDLSCKRKTNTVSQPIERKFGRKRKSNFDLSSVKSDSEDVLECIPSHKHSAKKRNFHSECVDKVLCSETEENLPNSSSVKTEKFSKSGRKIRPVIPGDIHKIKLIKKSKSPSLNLALPVVDSGKSKLSVPNKGRANRNPKDISRLSNKSSKDINLEHAEHPEKDNVDDEGAVVPNRNGKTMINSPEWYRIEARMFELDQKIKMCLSAKKKAKVHEALNLINQFDELRIKPLMLKKHAHIVSTIKTLRKYVGNTRTWNFTFTEQKKFEEDAVQIRRKARQIFDNFTIILGFPKNLPFNKWFQKELNAFRENTASLTLEEVSSLVVEPMLTTQQIICDKQ